LRAAHLSARTIGDRGKPSWKFTEVLMKYGRTKSLTDKEGSLEFMKRGKPPFTLTSSRCYEMPLPLPYSQRLGVK